MIIFENLFIQIKSVFINGVFGLSLGELGFILIAFILALLIRGLIAKFIVNKVKMIVLKNLKVENDDQRYGVDIVRKALSAPLKQIAQNAGHDGAVIAGKILESKDNSYGFDAQSGKFCDLVKAGFVDPTKVVRTALIDAVSVAALLTTTEAMITDKPEDKSSAPAMPDMGGMGGMGGGMPGMM